MIYIYIHMVGGFKHLDYFPFHIWDNPNPIDEIIFFNMIKNTNQHFYTYKVEGTLNFSMSCINVMYADVIFRNMEIFFFTMEGTAFRSPDYFQQNIGVWPEKNCLNHLKPCLWVVYLLVNSHVMNWKITMLLMGKSTN